MANNYEQTTVVPHLALDAVSLHLLTQWEADDSLLDETGQWTLEEKDIPKVDDEGVPQDMDAQFMVEWKAAVVANQLELGDDYRPLDCAIAGKNEEGLVLYYLYAEDGSFTGGHAAVLQRWLQMHGEEDVRDIFVEGAITCSKMRPGEFGGFACYINRNRIEWINTAQWLNDMSLEHGHEEQS